MTEPPSLTVKKRTEPAMPAVPIAFWTDGASMAPGVRAQWITQRLNEMPQLLIFLYNAMIDPQIAWRFKHHMFCALRYVFDPVEGVVKAGDATLARVDDLCMLYRCLRQVTRTMPPAFLARYLEVLYSEGIDLHQDLEEAPFYLGALYTAVARTYPPHFENLKELAGNAIKTGELVRKLHGYVASHERQAWSSERMLELERTLEQFG